jgi:Domain of unknown function (DUF4349)
LSQLDLTAQLRSARPAAPAELRDLVRTIAAQAAPEPRRRQGRRRRAFLVAVPVLAAAVGAAVLLPSGGQKTSAVAPGSHLAVLTPAVPAGAEQAPSFSATSSDQAKAAVTGAGSTGSAIPSSTRRIEQIDTTLELRVKNSQAVSDGTKQAVAITRALGGYPSALNVEAEQRTGYANLVLRIPKQNVQKAVTRLSALGTIIGENVAIKDIQARVDTTTRRIERLVAQRAAWEKQFQTAETQKHISSLTDQIGKLRRGRSSTIRNASFATVRLNLTTREAPAPVHQGNGPFHDLGVAFRMIGIGAVYAIALGAPLLILLGLVWLGVRTARRHRENALLSRS